MLPQSRGEFWDSLLTHYSGLARPDPVVPSPQVRELCRLGGSGGDGRIERFRKFDCQESQDGVPIGG